MALWDLTGQAATREKLPPAGISGFIRSASPDWIKNKSLCDLCASVVNLALKKTVGWAAHGPLELLNAIYRRLRPWGRPVAIDLPPPPVV
jgi:hypothetical protein